MANLLRKQQRNAFKLLPSQPTRRGTTIQPDRNDDNASLRTRRIISGLNNELIEEYQKRIDQNVLNKKKKKKKRKNRDWARQGMSYSHSKKWVSTSQKEQRRWRNIEAELRRNFPMSPFPPRTYAQWVDFQLARRKRALETKLNGTEGASIGAQDSSETDTESTEQQQRHDQHISEKKPQDSSPYRNCSESPAFHGKIFEDGRSAVLARPTIWRKSLTPTVPNRHVAAWPNSTECKWEGDDRARSGVGRYLPLPRAGGNDTVAWHQRPMLEPLPFDAVRKVPTMEDVYNPVDEIPGADICFLVNKSVLIAVV